MTDITLRDPFPPEVVGQLPRVTCTDCSKKDRVCNRHQKVRCQTCGAFVSEAHIHLDYVGHAEVTDRLLSVDPEWNWEPVGWNDLGLPAIAQGYGGETVLWIRLTVLGVTRLGVGSVAAGAFDTEKQLIGDALRNAAMRFGVALDLWAKSELESSLPAVEPTEPRISIQQATEIHDAFDGIKDADTRKKAKAAFVDAFGAPESVPVSQADNALAYAKELAA